MQRTEPSVWDTRIRVIFWIVGLSLGTILIYTTRYYINTDGPKYFEMSDSLRDGSWLGLVNTSESPGYPVLLGIAQIILGTTTVNELPILKVVNWLLLVVAMAACDLFVTGLRQDVEELGDEQERPLPLAAISGLAYSFFLYLALGWVRVRLVAPDMMVFALLLVTMWLILRIRRDPCSYADFLALGVVNGLNFLFKAFFFPFSVFILVLAGLVTGSFRKAIPGVLLSAAIMLIVSAPLLVALSGQVGRFSYGETGSYNYVRELAGKGDPVHRPERINSSPQTDMYRDGPGKTNPAGQDLAYWTLGVKPFFDPRIQGRVLAANVYETLSFSYSLFVLAGFWLLVHAINGRLSWGRLWPPSLFLVLVFLAIPGIGLYCLVHVEPRYLAGFFFFPLVAITLVPRYRQDRKGSQTRALIAAAVAALFLLEGVVATTIDQSVRGLQSTKSKISHQEAFSEFFAINSFLERNGIKSGDETAVVGSYNLPPIYWARMAGIRITGSIPHEEEFTQCSTSDRERALNSLRKQGIKAVVAKGGYMSPLAQEGWQVIPGTRDYYVFILR